MGGGTLDVSILLIDDGIFEVIATAGNTHLGGEDFDKRLVDFISEQFFIEHQIDITDNRSAMRRLKTACERAKRALSTDMAANLAIDAFVDGIALNATITRDQFEDLIGDLLVRSLEPVEKALLDARIGKKKVKKQCR